MKTITLIVRGDVNVSPTVTNYLSAFVNCGYSVNCICSFVSGSRINGVSYFELGLGYSTNFFRKVVNYYLFGQEVKNIINSHGLACSTDIFWVSRIDTALCLTSLFRNSRAVLALHEMHDAYPIWKLVTKNVISNYNSVVYNEPNRAQIGRVFYKLDKLPYVIPNKPSIHPRDVNLPIVDEFIRSKLKSVEDKFIIIYQGSLQSDRNLLPLVQASKLLGEDFCLIIMGKDTESRVDGFLEINESIVYFPWVIPPDHLAVTSHCSVGVAFYDTDCLNSIYCAPNKIWEYSGFGIPVLGQNIPGLELTVDRHNFGRCVDLGNVNIIVDALMDIKKNHSRYSKNASEFYDSIDFDCLVGEVIEKSLS